MSVFLDTNILLYAVGLDESEAVKRQVARSLLARDDAAVSVQVFQEFVSQATRRSRAHPLTIQQAWRFVSVWRRLGIQENTMALLEGAHRLHAQHGFSWWDSIIVAAAQALGCDCLYTEDMQDGRIVDGLRIINPFRAGVALP